MKVKIRGILLQSVRHNDKHNIVTLYTESHGRMAFLSSASTGKVGKVRKSLLSPLAVIETDVNFNATRELQYLSTISVPHVWRNIYFDPDKITMTFFLSDFLSSLLRKTPEDQLLFAYLIEAIRRLDETTGSVVNFHICFLIRLLPFMGIEPDFSTYHPGEYFDMREGTFARNDYIPHQDIIPADYAQYIPILSRISFDNMYLYKFSGQQRRLILSYIMRYYSIHLDIPAKIKSLEILQELYR